MRIIIIIIGIAMIIITIGWRAVYRGYCREIVSNAH